MCQQAGWCIQGKRVIPSNLFTCTMFGSSNFALTCIPKYIVVSRVLSEGCEKILLLPTIIIQKQQGQEVGIAEIKNIKLCWFSRPNASLVYPSVRNKKKRENVLYKIDYIWERLQDLDHGLYLVLDWKFEKRARSLQG